MTLLDVIRRIETAARGQRPVKTVVRGDVLRLNTLPDATYGVFAWVQRQHAEDLEDGTRAYAFSLFYVDRLTADKSNELEIQSVGIRVLENILQVLESYEIFAGDHVFETFNQRFTDECAGVWTDVTFTLPLDTCLDDFAEGGTASLFTGTPSTLRDVVVAAEACASLQPAVASCVRNDIYRLSTLPAARYGVFAWTQRQHSRAEDSPVIGYRFAFFYVDRLTADGKNETEVQSVGMDVLSNILAGLDELGLLCSDITFDAFTERFTDECAGVFANVTVSAPVASVCGETTGDFNFDFNDDFLIF